MVGCSTTVSRAPSATSPPPRRRAWENQSRPSCQRGPSARSQSRQDVSNCGPWSSLIVSGRRGSTSLGQSDCQGPTEREEPGRGQVSAFEDQAMAPTTTTDLFDMTGQVAVITSGSRGLATRWRWPSPAWRRHRHRQPRWTPARRPPRRWRRWGGGPAYACHVGDWDALGAVEAANAAGHVDVLVSNAGMSPLSPGDRYSEALFDKVIEVSSGAVPARP